MFKMNEKNKYYIPLILVEIYLICTLLLYQFGPLDWHTENELLFYFFIFAYHLMFIIGYVVSIKKTNVNSSVDKLKSIKHKMNYTKITWVIIIICILCALIEYKNTTYSTSYIPWELPQSFINGLINPAEQYYSKFIASQSVVSNKLVTLISALLAFIYTSMIPYFIFNWKNITNPQKVIFYFLVFFKLSMFISIGTNKGIFDTLFLFAGCLFLEYLINCREGYLKELIRQKSLIIFTICIFLFSFTYFTYNISSRVGGEVIDNSIQDTGQQQLSQEVAQTEESQVTDSNNTSKENLEDSELNSKKENNTTKSESSTESQVNSNEAQQETQIGTSSPKENTNTEDSFFNKMYYSISSYLTQGYYGMSLSLDEPFTTTYGIGHSQFLKSNFKSIFNIDVQNRTYQHKITEQWDEYEKWHSFYSYIANDISFYGVIIFMFLLGLYSGAVYKDALDNNSLVAKLILPLLLIMFMYMPANNQLLTNMGTFCAFIELSFLWVLLGIFNIRRKNGK